MVDEAVQGEAVRELVVRELAVLEPAVQGLADRGRAVRGLADREPVVVRVTRAGARRDVPPREREVDVEVPVKRPAKTIRRRMCTTIALWPATFQEDPKRSSIQTNRPRSTQTIDQN